MHKGLFVLYLPKLQDGLNSRSFEIGDSFFEQREFSLIQQGQFAAAVQVTKGIAVHQVDIHLHGVATLNCDRCNEQVQVPMTNRETFVAKPAGENEGEEVIPVDKSDQSIDLEPFIYDLISTAVPLKVTCELAGPGHHCNPDALKKLSELNQPTEETDHRWDKLKNLT